MKLSPAKIILFTLSLLLFTSCDWLDTNTDVSSNPSFYSLKFAANDTIPGLEDAVFTLEWDETLQDSIIVNLDSLPYQTDITHVIATFKFYSTSTAELHMLDTLKVKVDTIDFKTLTDTLDFTRVLRIKNTASDEVTTSRSYPIKVNIHTVNPDKYIWKKIYDEIYSHSGSAQKAIYFNDSIFLYVNSGVNNYLYVSPAGSQWEQKAVTGLPMQSVVRNMYQFGGKLYLMHDENAIYSSSNGYTWTKADYSAENYKFINFLFDLKGKAWAVTQSKTDNTYRFAHSTNGSTWVITGEIPENFPIGDFAALSFYSRTNKPKAIVAGGFNTSGKLLKNVWSTEDGMYWVDFSTENTTFGSLAGATMISYADEILLFGGMDDEGNVAESPVMHSIDEGYSWSVPDSADNYIQELVETTNGNKTDTSYVDYQPRSYQSVLYVVKQSPTQLYSQHFIYLIGGKNRTTVFKDVWTGKLNKLSFLREDN